MTTLNAEQPNIADQATEACYAAAWGDAIVCIIKHNRARFTGKPLAARVFTLAVCRDNGIAPRELLLRAKH